ncbi:MAG: glycosyltransferase family 39 protein [Actinomycetota bacterium]
MRTITRPKPAERAVGIAPILLVAAYFIAKLPALGVADFWDAQTWSNTSADILRNNFYPIPLTYRSYPHPPLPFEAVALVWRALGAHQWAAHLLTVAISCVTLVLTWRCAARLYGRGVGLSAAIMLAASPLFFSLSGQTYPEVFQTVFAVAAVDCLFAGRRKTAILLSLGMVLSKESGAVLLICMAGYAYWTSPATGRMRRALSASAFALPILGLAAWLAFDSIRHSAPDRVAEFGSILLTSQFGAGGVIRHLVAAVAISFYQMFVANGQVVVLAGVLAALAVIFRRECTKRNRRVPQFSPEEIFIAGAVAVLVPFHSLFGNLPRYNLLLYPLLFVLAAGLADRALKKPKHLPLLAGGVALLMATQWFATPGRWMPLDSNMSFTRLVAAEREAAAYLENRHRDSVILAPWPVTERLAYPVLDHVDRPLHVFGPYPPEECIQECSYYAGRVDWEREYFDIAFYTPFGLRPDLVLASARARGMKELRRFGKAPYQVILFGRA